MLLYFLSMRIITMRKRIILPLAALFLTACMAKPNSSIYSEPAPSNATVQPTSDVQPSSSSEQPTSQSSSSSATPQPTSQSTSSSSGISPHTHHSDHAYLYDENEHWQVCDVCGEQISKGDHKFSFVDYPEPTYEEFGTRIYTCDTCGYSYEQALPKKAHTYGGEFLPDMDDTTRHYQYCTDPGYETLKGNFQDHDYEELTIQEIDYEHDGITAKVCRQCHFEEPGSRHVTPHYEHHFSDEWTSISDTEHAHMCTDYGYETLHIGDEAHNFSEWEITPATETTDGYRERSCSVCGFAQHEVIEEKKLIYSIVNNKAVVTGVRAGVTELSLPRTIDGYTVRYEGDPFKNNTSIKTLTIEEGVSDVLTSFDNSAIETLNLPSSLVNLGSFDSCYSLTSVTLPSNLTTYKFSNCYALESVTINGRYIPEYAFRNCLALKTVSCSQVRNIGSYAFEYCTSLEEFTLGEYISNMGTGIFNNSGLKRLDTGTSVRADYIQYSNFENVVLDVLRLNTNSQQTIPEPHKGIDCKKVIIGSNVTDMNYFFTSEYLTTLEMEEGSTNIGEYAFQGAPNLENITFSNTLVSIGGYAFEGLLKITELEFPSSLKFIGDHSFANCKNLESYTLGENSQLANIAEYAFFDCFKLLHAEFSTCLTGIAEHAFSGCYDVQGYVFIGKNCYLGRQAFGISENRQFGPLTFTHFTVFMEYSEYRSEIEKIQSSRVIDINEGAEPIVVGDFHYVINGDHTVKVVNWVKYDGKYCEIPDTITWKGEEYRVTEIGDRAFEKKVVEEVQPGIYVTKVGNYAFSQSKLKHFDWRNVETIGEYAFGWCEDFSFEWIGEHVTTVDPTAFVHCDGVERIYITKDQEDLVTALNQVSYRYCVYVLDPEFDTWTHGEGGGIYINGAYKAVAVDYEAKIADGWEYLEVNGGVELLAYRGDEGADIDVTIPTSLTINSSSVPVVAYNKCMLYHVTCNKLFYTHVSGMTNVLDLSYSTIKTLEIDEGFTYINEGHDAVIENIIFPSTLNFDASAMELHRLAKDAEHFEIRNPEDSNYMIISNLSVITKDGKKLCYVGDNFHASKITDNVETISMYCFAGNYTHLKTVELPKVVTIGWYALSAGIANAKNGEKFKFILPTTVTSIPECYKSVEIYYYGDYAQFSALPGADQYHNNEYGLYVFFYSEEEPEDTVHQYWHIVNHEPVIWTK